MRSMGIDDALTMGGTPAQCQNHNATRNESADDLSGDHLV